MLVGAISISSFFSFWKLNQFSDMNCLKKPLSYMISCSSSAQLITSDIRVRYWPRIYSLNVNAISVGEILTKGFPVCVLYNLRMSLHENHSSQVAETYSAVYLYQWINMAPKCWAQIFWTRFVKRLRPKLKSSFFR